MFIYLFIYLYSTPKHAQHGFFYVMRDVKKKTNIT